MSFYQDDQERLRKMREALQKGSRPGLQRPGRAGLSNPDPYKHNSYLNSGTAPIGDTRPVQGPSETGALSKFKDFVGTAPSTKKDYMGSKPGFDLMDIVDYGKARLIDTVAPFGAGTLVKGMLDPAAAKEGTGLLGLNAKTGANFRAGVGDLVQGTGDIMKWTGDKLDNETLQRAGKGTADFADQHLIEDYQNPYSKEFTWKSLFDPEFYATSVSRSMPFMLSMIAPGAAGFSIGAKAGSAIANMTKLGNFGKGVIRATAGGIGGTAATAPFEAAFEGANVYKEALSRGMTEEEADAAADSVFKQNLQLLGISSVPELAAVFSPFKGGAGMKGAMLNAGKVAGSALLEGGQEVGQEFISAKALGDKVDPAAAKESFAIGALMGGGMNAFSKLGESDPITMIKNRVRERMSDSLRSETDSMREELQAAGATPEEADEAILERVAETEEGQQHINEATQEVITKLSEQSDDDIEQEEAPEPEDLPDVDEFNPGDKITMKNISGEFEVVDNSDPSMLTVKNKFGNELKVGRGAVKGKVKGTRQELADAMLNAVVETGKKQVEQLPDAEEVAHPENAQQAAGDILAQEQTQTPEQDPATMFGKKETPYKNPGEESYWTTVDGEEYYVTRQGEHDSYGVSKVIGRDENGKPNRYSGRYVESDIAKRVIEQVKNENQLDGEILTNKHGEHRIEFTKAPQTAEQLREEVTQAVNEAVGKKDLNTALSGLDPAKQTKLRSEIEQLYQENWLTPYALTVDQKTGEHEIRRFPANADEQRMKDQLERDDVIALMPDMLEAEFGVAKANLAEQRKRPPLDGMKILRGDVQLADMTTEQKYEALDFIKKGLADPEFKTYKEDMRHDFEKLKAAIDTDIKSRQDEQEKMLKSEMPGYVNGFDLKDFKPGESVFYRDARTGAVKESKVRSTKGNQLHVEGSSFSGKQIKEHVFKKDESYVAPEETDVMDEYEDYGDESLDDIRAELMEEHQEPKKETPYEKAAREKAEKQERENVDEALEGLANTLKEYPTDENAEPMKLEDIEFSRYTGTPQQFVAELNEGDMPFIPDFFRRGVPVQTAWFFGPRDKKMVTFRERGGKFKPAMPAEQLFNILEPIDYTNERHIGSVTGKSMMPDGINVGDVIVFRRGGKEFFGVLAKEESKIEGHAEVHNFKGEFDMNVPYNDIIRKATYEEVPPRFKKIMDESTKEEPKNEATEKYEAHKERVNEILADGEKAKEEHFDAFRKLSTATDYMYASDKNGTTLTFTSPAPAEAAQALDKLGFKASQQIPGLMTNSKKVPKETVEKAIRKHLDKVAEEQRLARQEKNKPEFSFKEGDKVHYQTAVGEVTKTTDEHAWVQFKDGIRKLLSFSQLELAATDTELTNFSMEQPKAKEEPVQEEQPKQEEKPKDGPFYTRLDSGDLIWNTAKKEVGEVRYPIDETDEYISVRTKIGYVSKVEYWGVKSIEPYNDQDKAAAEPAAPAETPAEQTIGGYSATIEEGKHTQTGEPIWKIKINEDIPKDKYGAWAGKHIKPFKGKFYNARSPIKELRGYFVFQQYPEGIFDNAEAKAAEESSTQGQEAASKFERPYFSTTGAKDEIEALNAAKPKNVLIAFNHFWNQKWEGDIYSKLLDKLNYEPEQVIIDSGAFKFHNDGTDIGLSDLIDQYELTEENVEEVARTLAIDVAGMDWDSVNEMQPIFRYIKHLQQGSYDYAFNLDTIGNNEDSYLTFRLLSSLPGNRNIIPVFSAIKFENGQVVPETDFTYLEKYAEMTDYIGIGGLAIKEMKDKRNLKAQIINDITAKYPDPKFHVLGTLDKRIIDQTKGIFSSDGTAWIDRHGIWKKEGKSSKAEQSADNIKRMEDNLAPKLPDLNNPEYNPVPSIMDEVMNDDEPATKPKNYNEWVLDFANELAKKKIFKTTVESKEYEPKQIVEMFSHQLRADVSARMMDELNEPGFDSDAWNKLTGEVGIRQIINNAIMNVKEGETNATTDTVRTDGKKPLAGTQAENVPGNASEQDAGSETVRSTGNSEESDSGAGGERNESSGSKGTGSAANNSSAAGRSGGRKNTVSGLVNYRLSKEDIKGIKGKKTTAQRNLEIIKLAKQIEAEGRPATEEEKKQLVQFVGWGALKPALDYEWQVKPEWKPFLEELKTILTPEELDSARASRMNAHYTAVDVIEGMYQGLEQLGFDGGRILEPSAGIGHFIGMLPDGMVDKSRVTAVEIEPMTALIGRLLYPRSDFRKMGFEEAKLGNNMYDLAIGNVPFSNVGVADKNYKRNLTDSLHNYFFVKSLDKVREGGLIMMITTSWSMDSKGKGYRQYLANRAELIGAIRLPNNAFKENAGTEVTTDILILKKLPEGQRGRQDWVETVDMEFPNPDYHKNPNWHSRTIEIQVNKYFEQNPHMVIGEIQASKAQHGDYQSAAVAKEGTDIKKEIAKRFKKLPKDVYEKPTSNILSPEEIMQMTIPAPSEVKEGAFHFENDQLYVKHEGNLVPQNLTGLPLERVKGLIKVRDALRELFYTELNDSMKAKKDGARKKLNTAYDTFVKKYGPINSQANVRAFEEDPDFYVMSNMEIYDPKTKKATKGEIFTNTTIARYEPAAKADNAREAMAISLNETGQVNLARIKELTELTESAIMDELDGQIFVDPANGRIVTREEYLSGNVRAKMQQAETAAEIDEQFKKNIEALQEVVPADIPAEGISASLGNPWVPVEYVKAFIGEHLLNWRGHRLDSLKVSYSPTSANWSVSVEGKPTLINQDKAFWTNWGHPGKRNTTLIEAALENKDIKVTYTVEDANGKKKTKVDAKMTAAVREKMSNIREEWVKWLWADEARKADLVRLYNDKFNSHVLREYNGSHLTFPGMNPEIAKLFRPYQKNAVYRATQGGNTLLAHAVGAGKTFEMIASIMELKRLGLVKKPMWVVPNHLVGQSAREFSLLYPNANILVPKKKELDAKGRKNLFAKIATRNYDVIIVPHSSFGNLSMSADNVRRFMSEQINQLEEAIELEVASGDRSDKRLTKVMEDAKKNLKKKMDQAVQKIEKDNDTATFEEVGVDAIVVDEAHEFKNLMFSTRRQSVGGLGDPEGSGKAFDLYMKVRYLNELNGGRGIIFATGTPISNSLAEMYHMMRYLAHNTLEELQVNNFDAWAALFADIQNVLEMAPEGNGYRMKNKVKGIVNAPELLTIFRAFSDVKTTEELLEAGLIKHPKTKREIVEVPANPALEEKVEELVERADRVRKKEVDPDEDNMLKITNEGRYAALDVRILDPENEDYPDNKVNYAKAKILDVWKRTKKEKGTQLVFVDLSTPGKEDTEEAEALNFSVYNDLKNKLIRSGIPKEEIAFIHDATNDKQKQDLFDKVNAGEIRVLIGSSFKMGAGMNVQKRLKALHHLDVPWRPSDIEQREGRILRHGNTFEEVEIYNYVQSGSFDAYMWQLIESKAKIINRVMSGDLESRTIEDDSEVVLNASKMKAIASGDERVFEYEVLKADVQKLELALEEHVRQDSRNQFSLREMRDWKDEQGRTKLQQEQQYLQKAKNDAAKAQDLTGDKFTVKIGDQTITKRADAGKFLFSQINKVKKKAVNNPQKIGEFSGFDIMYSRRQSLLDSKDFHEDLYLEGDLRYTINLGDENGTIRSMEAKLPSMPRIVEESEMELENIIKAIAALEAKVGQPFPKGEELIEKRARRDELQAALSIEETQEEIVLEEEVEEEGRRASSVKAFAIGTDAMSHNITPKTAKDVSDKLANIMNTVLRTGNVKMKGAAATYTPHKGTGNIKDKYLHNIRITAHELGHAFEEYGFEGDTDELINVARQFYPGFDGLKNRADKISEGKAELFTMYVLNPEIARQLAPITVEEIENVIVGEKSLEKAFKEIREMIEKDKGKAFFEKGLGSIAMPSEKKKSKTIGDEYYVENVPESAEGKDRIMYTIGGKVKGFLTKYVDYKIPFADMQRERTDPSGKDLVKMLAVTGNAEAKARHVFTEWATDHMGRYIINYRNRSQLPDYLMDTYDELNALDPRNAKADTPLIERYKRFFQEHGNKEQAILEAISSRSLQEIAEDGMYLIQQQLKSGRISDALKEEAGRIKKENKENPEFAYFTAIIQAYRAGERYARKDDEGNQKFTEVFMSEETAFRIIEATQNNFPGLENLIIEYTENLSNIILTKLVNAGVTTEEARARIEEGSAFYIPTYYAFKNPQLTAEAAQRKTAGQPIKAFSGKQAEVIDFLRASIYKLMEVEQSVEFKGVLDEVEKGLREEGMGKFGEILPQNRIPKSVLGSSIAGQVTEQLRQILGDDVVTENQIEESIVNNVYTVFFPTEMLKDKAPILMNWHDNKKVYMRLAPDLYNSIRSMTPIQVRGALRVMSKFSSFTRHLAITNPRYFLNVISRDLFSTQIQKNVAQNTIKGFLKGAALAWGKDQRIVDQYINSGAFVSAQENILNSFKRGSVVDGLIDTKAKNWKRTKKNRLVHMLSPSSLLTWQEQINRYGAWEGKARELAAREGIDVKKIFDGREPLTPNEFKKMEKIILELGYEASEVTTNFRGHGTSEGFRQATAPITFLHGTIQGLYREAREIRTNPKRALGRSMFSLMPITILSWALLQALDDDGDDITSEMKDKYWIFPVGNTYVMIAKPFGYALPFSHMERMLDDFIAKDILGKEEARSWYEDFWNPTKHNLSLPFLPIYGSLALNLYANKTWYDAPIVPMGMDSKPKDMQYDADTSLLAKFQADVMYGLTGSDSLVISPKKFDYAARQLFGEAGKVTLNALDNVFGKETPLTKNPFKTDKEQMSSRSVEKFYNNLDKLEKEHDRSGTPYKPAPELQKQREAQQYLSLFRKVEQEVKSAENLSGKDKIMYQKKIVNARKDLTRFAAGHEPNDRENLMEIVGLANRYKELEKQRKKNQR